MRKLLLPVMFLHCFMLFALQHGLTKYRFSGPGNELTMANPIQTTNGVKVEADISGRGLSPVAKPMGSSEALSPPVWIPIPNLQFNMNIIGKIQLSPGVFSLNGNDIIGAFVGTQCRGKANPVASLGGIIFLTIGSNVSSGETVTFKIYLSATDQIVDANETIPFMAGGEVGTFDNPYIFTYTNVDKPVELKLFLEGLFDGVEMNKAQNALGDQYSGAVADQLTVELHKPTDPFALFGEPYTVNLDTNGKASFSVASAINSSYYIVLRHRNHIETWSKEPVSFSGSSVGYDFTTSAGLAFGGNLKQLAVSPSVYGLYAGNVNDDETVDSQDILEIKTSAINYTKGYVTTDVNGDGIVDALDLIMVDNNAASFVKVVKP